MFSSKELVAPPTINSAQFADGTLPDDWVFEGFNKFGRAMKCLFHTDVDCWWTRGIEKEPRVGLEVTARPTRGSCPKLRAFLGAPKYLDCNSKYLIRFPFLRPKLFLGFFANCNVSAGVGESLVNLVNILHANRFYPQFMVPVFAMRKGAAAGAPITELARLRARDAEARSEPLVPTVTDECSSGKKTDLASADGFRIADSESESERERGDDSIASGCRLRTNQYMEQDMPSLRSGITSQPLTSPFHLRQSQLHYALPGILSECGAELNVQQDKKAHRNVSPRIATPLRLAQMRGLTDVGLSTDRYTGPRKIINNPSPRNALSVYEHRSEEQLNLGQHILEAREDWIEDSLAAYSEAVPEVMREHWSLKEDSVRPMAQKTV
ncbi:hypothetical protein DFH08DRAFT_945718 [Mycena albidolilacea]|uniref:Uncharacterized protein n=1 Tax=Mycena albidolilacea TaxID=1033008 RepID=A0AAD6YZK9_9AGAR|nr:hypothetical protein DFH08DRAFT_945718 [Mycena albidolilacea]